MPGGIRSTCRCVISTFLPFSTQLTGPTSQTIEQILLLFFAGEIEIIISDGGSPTKIISDGGKGNENEATEATDYYNKRKDFDALMAIAWNKDIDMFLPDSTDEPDGLLHKPSTGR